jgi:H+/gluconate symporter-like permease
MNEKNKMKIELKKTHTREEWISFIIHIMQFVLVMIIAIGLASAINYTIEAGESTTIQLPEIYASYNITGNSSEVSINQSGLDVNITVSKYEDNNFNITFFNEKGEVIHHRGHHTVILKNMANQSQQENSSFSSEKDSNFSTLADNTLLPILNMTSDELNKETKGFFNNVLDFLKSYWIAILIILLMIFLSWLAYYLYEEYFTEEEIKGYVSPEIKSIEFPKDENQTTN